jgi:hypothetical protein
VLAIGRIELRLLHPSQERIGCHTDRPRGLVHVPLGEQGVQVADQVVKLRQESERLAKNQLTQGLVLVSERQQSTAATYKAQADYLQASLGYLLAWAELEQAAGRTPGL